MAIWISSDWYCNPEGLREGVADWIGLGKAGGHRLIGAGDLFNILPLGEGRWENSQSVRDLAAVLDGYEFLYVAGNHDPYGPMVGLTAPYPNIKMHTRLEFQHQGRTFFVTHGHRWAIDWGFLGLRRIAPPLVEFMTRTRWLRNIWYWISRRMGWLASHEKERIVSGEESQRINKLTQIIWAGASRHAIEKNCCVILGHTHTTGYRERGTSRDKPCEAYMADGGNLTEGSYIEIGGDGEKLVRIKWLPKWTAPGKVYDVGRQQPKGVTHV